MRCTRVLAAGLVTTSVVVACGVTEPPKVARVSIVAPHVAADAPTASAAPDANSFPLAAIASALPKTLPPNPRQACNIGPLVRIELTRGTTRSYGPCTRPASIERLRLALVKAGLRYQRPSLEGAPFPVGSTEWKAVFADWYANGKFDRWHPCTAVREAIKHLPADGAIYSTIADDLAGYAGTVC
jgi:hypothetical protein